MGEDFKLRASVWQQCESDKKAGRKNRSEGDNSEADVVMKRKSFYSECEKEEVENNSRRLRGACLLSSHSYRLHSAKQDRLVDCWMPGGQQRTSPLLLRDYSPFSQS